MIICWRQPRRAKRNQTGRNLDWWGGSGGGWPEVPAIAICSWTRRGSEIHQINGAPSLVRSDTEIISANSINGRENEEEADKGKRESGLVVQRPLGYGMRLFTREAQWVAGCHKPHWCEVASFTRKRERESMSWAGAGHRTMTQISVELLRKLLEGPELPW